jgi:uncharacterized membrane protein
MSNGHPAPDQAGRQVRIWRRVVGSAEGRILLAGVAMAVAYLAAVELVRLRSPGMSDQLRTMTVTHILTGRAAGLFMAETLRLPRWISICANTAIEVFMVLIFFPLFVFSYNRLIVIKPVEETLRRARAAAEAHQASVMKWGIPGLLVFVWFPFWMTGPLIGSIIGFLIGLRTWVNLAVVLVGTSLAIFCWSLFIRRVYEFLQRLGFYIPFLFMGCILLVAVSIHIRYAFLKPDRAEDGEARRQ